MLHEVTITPLRQLLLHLKDQPSIKQVLNMKFGSSILFAGLALFNAVRGDGTTPSPNLITVSTNNLQPSHGKGSTRTTPSS